jgi:hypothetical protein
MTCQAFDPIFILLLLVGVPWAALVFTGLVYGLRASARAERGA